MTHKYTNWLQNNDDVFFQILCVYALANDSHWPAAASGPGYSLSGHGGSAAAVGPREINGENLVVCVPAQCFLIFSLFCSCPPHFGFASQSTVCLPYSC